jgi:hypothetical protein
MNKIKNIGLGLLALCIVIFSFSNRPYIVSTEKIRVTQTADLATVPATTADLLLVIDVGTTIAAGTLVFPTAPIDGQSICVSTRSQITAVTLDAGGRAISGSISTLAAGGVVEWVYDQASNRWFRH